MLAQAEPGPDAAGGIAAALSGPGGPALTARTATAADGEGPGPLFRGLFDEDRHHRFFNLRRPAPKFAEQMTRAADQGGYRLVTAAAAARGVLNLHQSRGDILRKWQ